MRAMNKPFKDDNGHWRGPFEKGDKRPLRCPKCRSAFLDYDCASKNGDFDCEMQEEWPEYGNDLQFFDYTWAVCEECGKWTSYGPRLYWNPQTDDCDLPRMLTRRQSEKMDAIEAARIIESAGQLKLPLKMRRRAVQS
jgi:hypothetical protein